MNVKRLLSSNIILVAMCVFSVSSVFAAGDSGEFMFDARRSSVEAILSYNTGKRVTVVLGSGVQLGGRIVDQKGELLYLSDERMRGRTDNHVLIRIRSIEALIFDATEFR